MLVTQEDGTWSAEVVPGKIVLLFQNGDGRVEKVHLTVSAEDADRAINTIYEQ